MHALCVPFQGRERERENAATSGFGEPLHGVFLYVPQNLDEQIQGTTCSL
jgi:hypothetical protein